MNRRQLLGSLGAFAATLALPHAGLALDWPSEAHPIHTWYLQPNGDQHSTTMGSFRDFHINGKNSGIPVWVAINAKKETLGRRWSDEENRWMPPEKAGDPYISWLKFHDHEQALDWSKSRAKDGYKSLAVVETGTAIRPPKYFNGKYGSVAGSGLLASLDHKLIPLRATWYEGQGL